jgi:hypothetical protein
LAPPTSCGGAITFPPPLAAPRALRCERPARALAEHAQSTGRLAPLGAPKPIRVEADERGHPLAVANRANELIPVAEIQDRWRSNDDWWCNEIHREYWLVVLDGVGTLMLVTDLMDAARWYLQHDTKAVPQDAPLDVMVPAGAARRDEKEQAG